MTRRQWMWLWIWLLLFFIIFCVWNKLQSFKIAKHNSIVAPVIITDPKKNINIEHNITNDMSLKITKDGDIVKLAGVFPSQDTVDQAIEALRLSGKNVQKGTIIIDPNVDNPKLRMTIADFAKILPKFRQAVIEYHQKRITLDGITSDQLAKTQLEASAKSLGSDFQINNLISYQKTPSTKTEATLYIDEADRNTTQTHPSKTPNQNTTMPHNGQDTTTSDTKNRRTNAQTALNKVLKGKRITFLYASDTLTPKSKKLLDQIAKILKRYPDIRVEIGGHTDSDGTEARNMKLSQRRAYAVKLYLIQKGINSKRLIARGYGESKPLVKNDTPTHKQQNRRVEFKVIP